MMFFNSKVTTIVSWTILALSFHSGSRRITVVGFELGTPADEVVALKVENYNQALQDPANSLWFLKFYAPWCGHCKKMAPILDKIAPKLKGIMAIGKIDCTAAEKKICDKYKIRGFPTLKFALDGEVYEYPGSRDEHSLMAFGKKMSGPSVTILNSYNDAMKYAAESTDDGVAFLGYDAQATGSDKDVLASTALAQVYAQAARKEKAFGHFLWLKPGAEGIGERATRFVSRIETGVDPQFWMDAAPASDETDSAITTESLLTFIRKENVPTLSTLGPTNFQKIGNSGRPLVISVLDMENKELVTAVKDHMVKFIASPLAKEYKEKYYFSLMDGKKWAKFLQQFNVLEVDNPQVFLLDVPSKHFWQNASYNTVGEFLNGVKNGTIPRGTSTGKSPPKGNLAKLEAFFWDAFPYSLIAISLVVIGIIFICIPSGDDMVPPYDREPLEYDDDDEGEDAKQEPTQGKETPAEETESKKVK